MTSFQFIQGIVFSLLINIYPTTIHKHQLEWGFYAHQLINRHAVYSLPPEMLVFYKKHIEFLSKHAVDPDKRRYAVTYEAPRHYIDLDDYPDDSLMYKAPSWNEAKLQFGEEFMQAHGIVPWHIIRTKIQLTDAFRKKQWTRILRLSADIGHYIGDANVPLHTTRNYNGQETGQRGIHGFWESRIPEISVGRYNLWIGKAEYVKNIRLRCWEAVRQAHKAVDSVLSFEKRIHSRFPPDKIYGFEERGNTLVKTYAEKYALAFEKSLSGQVERQLVSSIRMTADFWYTAWVDAGQPALLDIPEMEEQAFFDSLLRLESTRWIRKLKLEREHESNNEVP